MENVMKLIESLFNLSTEHQTFILAVLALLVAGFSLYVVLAVIKNSSDNRSA